MPKSNPNGRRANRNETFTDWKPHRGPFKLIKLKPGEGLTPPMQEDGKHVVRINVHKQEWS